MTTSERKRPKPAQKIAKADAELKASKKSLGHWLIEGTKVIGAVIIGLGGITAAITGYQLAEVKKERSEFATEKLKDELRAKSNELTAAAGHKAELDRTAAMAQAQLDTTREELGELRVQLTLVKRAAPESSGTAVLDAAIKRTGQIQEAVNGVDIQLRSAKDRSPDDNTKLEQLTNRLFSEGRGERVTAYNTITSKHRNDPEAVTTLLHAASQRMDNKDGVFNTVITLRNLNPSVTQRHRAEITSFCDKAETSGSRTKAQCDILRTSLQASPRAPSEMPPRLARRSSAWTRTRSVKFRSRP